MTKLRPGPKPSGVIATTFAVRLPRDMAEALHIIAKTRGTSRNKLINDLLKVVVNEAKQ